MKKIVLAALAASMLATPAFAAPQSRYQQPHRTVVVQRHAPAPQFRNWRKGERFDSRFARNYQAVDYRHYRGLRAPPRGYRYVRSGNDAVLVGITTGIIAAVIANAIH